MAATNGPTDLAHQVNEESAVAAHSLSLNSLRHGLQTMKTHPLGEGAGDTDQTIPAMRMATTVPLRESDYVALIPH
jgi:hypothetical protein